MSAKTKILVLKLKEIIFTITFVVLGIILILLLVLIITGRSRKNSAEKARSTFSPGVYTTSIILSSNPVDLEVVVDHEQIKSISMLNMSDAVTTMYPLITSSLESVASQVISNNSTENVTYSQDNKYTSIVLVKAISQALEKAQNTD